MRLRIMAGLLCAAMYVAIGVWAANNPRQVVQAMNAQNEEEVWVQVVASIVSGVLTVVAGVVIWIGAAKMARLESHPWAMTAAILACVPLAMAVTAVVTVAETYTAIPYMDQWAAIDGWRRVLNKGLTWKYLFSQHNEHRILLPRLVFLADIAWFRGRGVLNLATIGVIQLIGGAFFAAAAWRQRMGVARVAALALALCLMACLAQWENFFWGFQVQFVGVAKENGDFLLTNEGETKGQLRKIDDATFLAEFTAPDPLHSQQQTFCREFISLASDRQHIVRTIQVFNPDRTQLVQYRLVKETRVTGREPDSTGKKPGKKKR